jgi:hypothetical protein
VLPFAVNVDELPEQTAVGEALAVIVGLGMTSIVIVCDAIQPKLFSPSTVYVVVIVGETIVVDPANNPGFQV